MFQAIEGILTNMVYDETKVPQWINQICEKIMENLVELEKPFKYIGMENDCINYYFLLKKYWGPQ